MDWIKEIEIEDILDGDAALIAETCGFEVLLRIWENLSGLSLYISTRPLTEAKKRYIRKFYDGKNAKQLATKLNVSERFIYNVVKYDRNKD